MGVNFSIIWVVFFWAVSTSDSVYVLSFDPLMSNKLETAMGAGIYFFISFTTLVIFAPIINAPIINLPKKLAFPADLTKRDWVILAEDGPSWSFLDQNSDFTKTGGETGRKDKK